MTDNEKQQEESSGLSSSKREDIWALIIAGIVMLASIAAPDAVYNFFKKMLYLF